MWVMTSPRVSSNSGRGDAQREPEGVLQADISLGPHPGLQALHGLLFCVLGAVSALSFYAQLPLSSSQKAPPRPSERNGANPFLIQMLSAVQGQLFQRV